MKKKICYRHNASGKMDRSVDRQKMDYECAISLLKVGESCQTFTVHPEDIAFMKDNMLSLIKLLNTSYLLPPNKKLPLVLHTVFLTLSRCVYFWAMVICCGVKLPFNKLYFVMPHGSSIHSVAWAHFDYLSDKHSLLTKSIGKVCMQWFLSNPWKGLQHSVKPCSVDI